MTRGTDMRCILMMQWEVHNIVEVVFLLKMFYQTRNIEANSQWWIFYKSTVFIQKISAMKIKRN